MVRGLAVNDVWVEKSKRMPSSSFKPVGHDREDNARLDVYTMRLVPTSCNMAECTRDQQR